MNEEIKQSAEDLKHIRQMMEESSKFLSLSGLSGIVAGIVALGGAFTAHSLLHSFKINYLSYTLKGQHDSKIEVLEYQLLLLAALVLIIALGLGFIFTYIKAKRNKVNLFGQSSYKVAWALFTPLSFGGAFTIILANEQLFQMAGAATLIFYGMSLLNASKYLNIEIKYLAISQMILGIFAAIWLNQVLIFWAVGFGVLHILYGAIMYFKYDRQ